MKNTEFTQKMPCTLRRTLPRTFHWLAVLLVMLTSACASIQPSAERHPRDPLEPINRLTYTFNGVIDKVLFRPVAEAYRSATPEFVQTGVSNFFGNLGDVVSTANHFLQGKLQYGLEGMLRVVLNSSVGMGGVFEVAHDANLPRRNNDFGATLGRYGVGAGPYVVLPLIGPSTLRDAVAGPVDSMISPVGRWRPIYQRNTIQVMRVVDLRAGLLDASDMLETVSLDPYTFLRDLHLQRRLNLIHDGDPPEQSDTKTLNLDESEH